MNPFLRMHRAALARAAGLCLALGLWGGATGPATAQSLPELLQAARSHDAAFLAAQAQFDSVVFRVEQARALKRASVTADATLGHSISSTPYSTSVTGSSNSAATANINAAQPLLNRASDAAIAQAEKSLEAARADLDSAQQDLILRVAQAYFDVLASRDALTTVQASKKAITEQLAFARRNFEVGTATITDTREAQARFDLVSAQEVAALNDVRNRQLVLDQTVGRLQVQPLPVKLPLTLPPLLPDSAQAWVQRGLAGHPQARKAQLGLDIAQLEVARARAGTQPTVSLTGRYSLQRIDGSATVRSGSGSGLQIGQVGNSTNATVGITLSVPLYSGRALDNRILETLKLEERARHEQANVRRAVELATRQAFIAIESLAAQVKALEAAEASSRLALEATQLGYKVGVRVNLDVLNAQGVLFQTQRDLAKARYDSILGSLRLRQAAGSLGPDDVQALSSLMGR